MLPKDIFRLPESKIRLWAVLGSLVLGVVGLFLGVSVTAAFFNPESFFSRPGFFFVRAYGLLAFGVPACFLYAALILADSRYRPDRIFVLCVSIIPFITLALGFYWIREYEVLRLQSSFIGKAGKLGIGFFVFFLVIIEILLVILVWYILFGRRGDLPGERFSPQEGEPGEEPELPEWQGFGSRNLKDIYAEAAAATAGTGEEAAAPSRKVRIPKWAPDAPVDDEDDETEDLAELESITEGEAAAYGEIAEESFPEAAAGTLSGDEDRAKIPALEEEEAPGEIPLGEISPGDVLSDFAPDGNDEDVEKALAEAAAFAEGEASRHGERKTGERGEKDAPRKIPPRKRRLPYFVPVEGILKQYPDGEYWIIDDETREAALTLKETFKEFNIQVEVTGIRKGPVITMFEILPAPGIRLAKIENLADNIALRLAAQSVRIVAPIPGKHAVGIEVPNAKRNIVSFREIIESEMTRDGKKGEVPVVLGKDITGEAVTVDLVQMPHLLIAGATGSGKSVCVNSMILTLLYSKPPAECRLILIDPKIVELKLYNDIPHLLTPVITEPKKAFQALQYCIYEMERRYACLDSMGVRDIRSYNRRIKERNIATEHMPYIVVVIDEFADLMATTGKELESTVARLAAMSRAVGIHLVLATQRPSIDVITGLIKANIPSRIAFMVASKMDSRIIIDMVGAEKLLGKGDMLYAGAVDPFPIRMQGAFISEEEVERVVDYVKSLGEPDYIDDEIFFDDEEEDSDPSLFSDGDDPLYEKALEIVYQQGKASASYIQRRLKIGYNRAARLVEAMEHNGVVGPAQGSKPRELLRGMNV